MPAILRGRAIKENVDMDELISKRAVIEAIEKARANVGHNLERSIGESIIEILDDVGRDVNRLPPAEPQIIRCKDCKNWDTTWTNDFSPNYHYCPMVDGVRKEDWFCADAERRTE